MSVVDLDALRETPLAAEPFPHVIVPGFVKEQALAAIERAFPPVDMPGSLPAGLFADVPALAALFAACQGPEMTAAVEDKLGIDLSGRPTMITVRARCRASDGKVHVDSKTKLVTVLIYLNHGWQADGGRLRLLRSPDLADAAVEVPPDAGTLLMFLNGPTAWHGHTSFDGPRRALQLNWVTDPGVVAREHRRHRWSAAVKRVRRLFGGR